MTPSAPANLDRYAAQLKEAEQVHGLSLARDAWRRLRRNSVAMISLAFLIAISLLAFFTPLLPLQSPYKVDTDASFAPPTARPLFVETLNINPPDAHPADDQQVAAPDWINKQFGDINGFNRLLVELRAKIFG